MKRSHNGRNAALVAGPLVALTGILVLAGPPARAQSEMSLNTLHGFSNQRINATYPFGRLLRASDGYLYGTTYAGGSGDYGTIFRYDPAANTLTLLYNFTGYGAAGTGSYPQNRLIQAADGRLYGTCRWAGANGDGTAFAVNLATSPPTVTKLHDFHRAVDGGFPDGLLQASDGYLYGVAEVGGQRDQGVVYRMGLDGSGFTIVYNFQGGTDGADPVGPLVEGNDGKLYGTLSEGGAYGGGGVFWMSKNGAIHALAHSFDYYPVVLTTDEVTELAKAPNGRLYGSFPYGGANGIGFLFSLNPSIPDFNFTVIHDFDGASGAIPWSSLKAEADGQLYGTTTEGGDNGYGTFFRLDPASGILSVLASFNGVDAYYPFDPPTQGADGNFYGVSSFGGHAGYGSLYSVTIDPVTGAGATTLLQAFYEYTDGFNAQSTPVIGQDGNLYGVTPSGGAFTRGVLYRAAPDGSAYQVLHYFKDYGIPGWPLWDPQGEGYDPSGVIQGPDGTFYGTCRSGGKWGNGTVWSIDPSGSLLTVLHHFRGPEGAQPYGRLLLGADGNLYGTTVKGGLTTGGVIFTLATDGTGFADLHDFYAPGDGANPTAGLVQDAAGVLYGAAQFGGANGYGAFFKLQTNGTGYAVLHSLAATEGVGPYGTPALASNGAAASLYASCQAGPGAAFGSGTLVRVDISSGATSVLHVFSGASDGRFPTGDLLLGADGALYDTCYLGGPGGGGTAWRCTLAGDFSVLQSFSTATGTAPLAGLRQGSLGTLYGVTSQDGPNGGGTLFSLVP